MDILQQLQSNKLSLGVLLAFLISIIGYLFLSLMRAKDDRINDAIERESVTDKKYEKFGDTLLLISSAAQDIKQIVTLILNGKK